MEDLLCDWLFWCDWRISIAGFWGKNRQGINWDQVCNAEVQVLLFEWFSESASSFWLRLAQLSPTPRRQGFMHALYTYWTRYNVTDSTVMCRDSLDLRNWIQTSGMAAASPKRRGGANMTWRVCTIANLNPTTSTASMALASTIPCHRGHCGHILSWVASSATRKGDVPYVSVLLWDGGTPSLGEGTLKGGPVLPQISQGNGSQFFNPHVEPMSLHASRCFGMEERPA